MAINAYTKAIRLARTEICKKFANLIMVRIRTTRYRSGGGGAICDVTLFIEDPVLSFPRRADVENIIRGRLRCEGIEINEDRFSLHVSYRDREEHLLRGPNWLKACGMNADGTLITKEPKVATTT